MSLTGLELNFKTRYKTKDKTGKNFYLGKLLRRENAYSPHHEAQSQYPNYFLFERMPPGTRTPGDTTATLYEDIMNSANIKRYDPATSNDIVSGGNTNKNKKRKSRKRKSTRRKRKSTRRKSNRRR